MARKALTNNGVKSEPVTIGLDIGYGVTKAVMDDTVIMFPSVAGHGKEIKYQAQQTLAKYPGEQIDDDSQEWFVGNLALSQLPVGQILRLRGRTANEETLGNVFRLRMAKVAIAKLFGGVHDGRAIHIRLATGLPVDHMRGASRLKKSLIGQHRILTNDTDFVAHIVEVMVMPQPYGTIYSKMLTSAGDLDPCHTATRTGVVDIGTYTIDVTLDDNGEYIDSKSGSAESGVYLAQQAIGEMLERDYNEKPDHRAIEGVLRTGCIKVRGQTISYHEAVDEALEPIRGATLNLMQEKWQTGLGVDVIYLSGGGAALVYENVKAAYPQTALLDDAQLANARGYLNYARFAAR